MKHSAGSIAAAQPAERGRLAALRRYWILDTPEDPDFDRFARLAARLLRTPIGLVSLVDEDRQWSKSHVGLELRETPRELSFCSYAITSDEVMVVRDATKDERFSGNPLVTGNAGLRFYAGAPLITTDGFRLGTLSVLDTVARHDLERDDFTTLEQLATLVMDHLDLRLARLVSENHAAKIDLLSLGAAAIAASDSIETALQLLADHTRHLVGVRRSVAMLTEGSSLIGMVTSDGADGGGSTRAYDRLEPDMISIVTKRRRATQVTRADLEQLCGGGMEFQSQERGSALALGAPFLRLDGQSFGAVLARDKIDGEFTAEDEALIAQLAHITSVHIKNLFLLQRTRAAEARFRHIVESGMLGIVFWDESGAVTEANDAYLALIGYTRTELEEGKIRWIDLTPPEYAELDRKAVEQVRKTGIFKPFEKEYIRKDGVRIPILVGGASLEEEGIPGVAFVLDMTERKRAEARTKESEHIARAIMDTALDAFVQMNEQDRIVGWNRQAESMFGWTREEAMGRSLVELLIPPRYRERHQTGIRRFLATGKASILGKRVEMPAQRRDGSEFQSELTVTALEVHGGHLFNGFIRDLTDKIAMETQLRHIQKMEAVGELTGGIAHDFNNILAVVIGNLDFLSGQPGLDPEMDRVVADTLDAALRGSDLTKRLLAFARRQPLRPEQLDLNELVRKMAELLTRVLPPNITVRLELADDLWRVEVDKSQLEGAITNLITNARDAMPNGGQIRMRSRNVEIRTENSASPEQMQGQFTVLDVSDTGTGMAPDVLARVFEPFFTTKEQGKGTGLGLSMVFGFMKQSGGHIDVHSQAGAGTTFSLYFRRTAGREGSSPDSAGGEVQKGSGTVLVVEDDGALRMTVVRQLAELGYRTMEASESESALAILRSGKPIDLLLTDIVMPGEMDGMALAQEAVALRPGLRVLLTSGFPAVRSGYAGKSGLQFPLLKKPYRKADLARAVNDALAADTSAGPRWSLT